METGAGVRQAGGRSMNVPTRRSGSGVRADRRTGHNAWDGHRPKHLGGVDRPAGDIGAAVADLAAEPGGNHGVFSRNFWQDEFTADEEDEPEFPWPGERRGSAGTGPEARERITGA